MPATTQTEAATEGQIYPTKPLAMRAGELSRLGYTVEPVGARDPLLPWRLVIDQPRALRQQTNYGAT